MIYSLWRLVADTCLRMDILFMLKILLMFQKLILLQAFFTKILHPIYLGEFALSRLEKEQRQWGYGNEIPFDFVVSMKSKFSLYWLSFIWKTSFCWTLGNDFNIEANKVELHCDWHAVITCKFSFNYLRRGYCIIICVVVPPWLTPLLLWLHPPGWPFPVFLSLFSLTHANEQEYDYLCIRFLRLQEVLFSSNCG